MLRVLDLFSGIGGFSLGLERTGGFRTIAFCEIDNFCQQVLHKHWPHVYIHSDIRTLGRKHFDGYERPDVIVGGFPCQDISVAGRGVGITGERSGLWKEMYRLIGELRPTWVVIENVPALRTRGADVVLADLEAENYAPWPLVVGAWALGASHKRERTWIVGHPKHDGFIAPTITRCDAPPIYYYPQGKNEAIELEGTDLRGDVAECALADPGSHRQQGQGEGRRRSYQSQDREGQAGDAEHGSHQFPAGLGQPQRGWEAPRRIEPGLGGTVDGLPKRIYKARLTALGNSVVPQIPEAIGRAILRLAIPA